MQEKPNPSYLASFRAHLADTQSHLQGTLTTTSPSLSPSFVLPSSYWSAAEKSRLFHALAVHSRLRPDLIAACVRTKSVVEVCVYIDLLREAAAALDETRTSTSAEAQASARRRALPCAMEVSDEWVAQEEAEAQILASVEPKWEAVAVQSARCAELDPMQDGSLDQEARGALRVRWEREDAFARLREVHLQVITSLVRESEDPEVTVAMEAGGRKRKRGEDEGSIGSKARRDASSEDDEAGSQQGAEGGAEASIDAEMPDLAALSPLARRRHQKRMYMRRKRAELTGATVVEGVARLKPGRPFRARKRREKNGKSSMESDEEPDKRHSHVGGITAPYAIKSYFKGLGINGATLREEGFDLIHLGTLARVMQ
jgi:hypothetical protein